MLKQDLKLRTLYAKYWNFQRVMLVTNLFIFQEDNDDLYLEPEGWFDHFKLAKVLVRNQQWEEN